MKYILSIMFTAALTLTANSAFASSEWTFIENSRVSQILSRSFGVYYRINRDGEAECAKTPNGRNCTYFPRNYPQQRITSFLSSAATVQCRQINHPGYYYQNSSCLNVLLQMQAIESHWIYDAETQITFKFNFRNRLIECASHDYRRCYRGSKDNLIQGLSSRSFFPKRCDDFSSENTVCSKISRRYGYRWVINAPDVIHTVIVGDYLNLNPDINSQTIADTNLRIINGEFNSDFDLPDNVTLERQDTSNQQLFSELNSSAHIINYASADFSSYDTLYADAQRYTSLLSITAAPDSNNLCNEQAADLGRKSGLAASDIAPIHSLLEMLGHTPENYIEACNMRHVAAVDRGLSFNWIIASAEGNSQQPGALWKNDWIVAPALQQSGQTLTSNRYASAYVSHVASLIHSRLPHLAPSHIKQIIFDTATDLGAPGVDPVYGAGRINLQAVIQRINQLRIALGVD